jgi:hypothetical protein
MNCSATVNPHTVIAGSSPKLRSLNPDNMGISETSVRPM